MVEKVEKWETSDKRLFDTEQEALQYEEKITLEKNFPVIHGALRGERTGFAAFHRWALQNRAWLEQYMLATNKVTVAEVSVPSRSA